MIQVFINRQFIENLVVSSIDTQTYVFDIFQKLAPYKLTLDIQSDDLFKLTTSYPMLRGLTSPLVEYRFLPMPINTEYITKEHIANDTLDTKFFFLESSEKTCKYYQNNYGLFVTNTGYFIEHFNNFFLNGDRSWQRNEIWLGISKDKKPKPLKWSDIASRLTISNVYFISDRYCYKIENREHLRNNLASLIVDIINCLPENIIPFFQINTIINPSERENNESYKYILIDLIKEKTTRAFKLDIYNLPFNLKKQFKLDDHTRFIASNYFFLTADQSFNFFDTNGDLENIICKIENSFRFSADYGYYFTEDFYSKFKKILSKSNTN